MVLKKIIAMLFILGLSFSAYAENENGSEVNETNTATDENKTVATKARIMYVRDDGDYYLRTNPNKGSALKGSVKAGDPVKVLDEKNGFYFIEDLKGRQKWIAATDVQDHPSFKIMVSDLKKANEELKEKLANIDSEQARELKELKQKFSVVASELQEAQKTLAAQKEKLEKVTAENGELSNMIENSEQEKQIRWAKIGALLVCSGALAGIILVYLPRPHRRRKDIW